MKKNNKTIIFVLLVTIVALGAFIFVNKNKGTNNSSANLITEKSGFMLGTLVKIKLFEPQPEELFEEAFNIIEDIENKMSINIKESEVMEINKNAGKAYVKVSPETYFVIKKGKYYSEISNGKFDISIGPLVKLWGIGQEGATVPPQKEIDEAISMIGYKDILLNESEQSVMLANEGMIIDLGAIAKGYTADVLAEFLRSKNINSGIIDLGGNVLALGAKDGKYPWSIGVQNPFDQRNKSIGVLKVIDKTIVASGVYERYFFESGKRYHHILDPFTGYPVENELMSVTIVADTSIDADGLSTTVFALGIENGMKLIEGLNGIDAIFVDLDKNVYVTSGLKDTFTIDNDEFKEKSF
ncbi:thiamine biosynthesis lipoprotein [Proteiniborus ethanoligenes]|uniref:FAD:protein FMN transferase n=1 Tax=Proteiniborus ethanoligenes TaxID=415015 RepID=A0A1H3RR50_9FIRM|nr:FAD:protein FMN transferase [Proteiniborus ethanoligenes]SDZ28157.1 thiamine biosynthesis lipoprotein [Proteiniborus ethanoligenes]